ncbi:MAG: InlB B-repeat-containing protein [Lachnospiraceae bacterium]|nr:InlB B-repeat-containing protein [Lachnospiraceae bacterium]
MKNLTRKMHFVRYLLAVLLAVVLFTPDVAEAANLTIKSGARKDYTANADGETINITLSVPSGNPQLMGKPSWVSQSGSSGSYKLVVAKNTSNSARTGDVVYRAGNYVYTLRITQKGQPKNTVTVKFNTNGGKTSVNSKTYKIGKKYGSLPAGPTPPTGKKFVGWYTKASGGTKITKDSKVSASTKTLYAHYRNKDYTVSFDSLGGSFIIAHYITYGTPYGHLETPEKAGYKFLGWYTAPIGGKKITSKTKMATANNHTLYAHWKEKAKCTVTIKYQGKTFKSEKIYEDEKYVLPYGPNPPKDHHFVGWRVYYSDGIRLTGIYKRGDTINIRCDCTLVPVYGYDYDIAFEDPSPKSLLD